MKGRKGFTLIELMVVILIVGILAAVAVPIMRGRIDSAKWSEANASAGAIKSAVRAYIAEKGPNFDYTGIETAMDVQATYGPRFQPKRLDRCLFQSDRLCCIQR